MYSAVGGMKRTLLEIDCSRTFAIFAYTKYLRISMHIFPDLIPTLPM